MLIKNAKLSDGTQVDVLIRDGKIAGLMQDMPAHGEEVIDAAGRTLLPGFIDLHCHWRTPGFEYKEDIATGSAAAAAGGYTFVNLMPNTKPVCSSAAQAHAVMDEAERLGICGANQTISITENFDGHTLDHLKSLPEDLRFITEDGKGVQNNQVMAKAFAICAQRDLVLMSHAEDMEISKWDYRLAENIETVRNLHLSEYYGTRLHMCHVSTKEAVVAIGDAKRRGVPVTCEVTPHHLWFADTDYRVNPPIRQAEDVEALVEAIRTGVVDAIATDHAPHSAEDKANGAAGMIGLETAFGVCYTKLCREQGLDLYYLEALMSRFPAAILGLAGKGAIQVGMDADLTLVELDTPYVVDAAAMHSKSHNTPFDGATLYGRVDLTIRGGRVTYQR
ncbi:dihydroorotase family protein [Fournierella sp.]|uniref:dihydroorotase n=1 Tax=Allofournierella sp. TaxID=1940256 RepID=UPI0025C6F546|nr:dihydroorotase [Fournierella sp.]